MTTTETTSKLCTKCKRELPLEGFHRNPGKRFGRYSQCPDCANAADRERRRANLETVRAKDRAPTPGPS